MKHTRIITLCAALFAASAALAQSDPESGSAFAIDWFTIDGGGGTSTGGAFSLTGTIGQHDAGGPMTGGAFAVNGGFWAGAGGGQATCTGDIDGDGEVDFDDFTNLLAQFGSTCPCTADLDNDNDVDFDDFTLLLAAFGDCP